jgi:glycosyltransferase involved in cell wall biosynthesis
MACNCPVVTVDVGDVKENLTGIKQCFVTNYDADKLAACVMDVLNSSERSDGRDKINDLQFDAEATANKIIGIYRKLLERKKK